MNLGEIRAQTRTFLNEPSAAFWTDAELNSLINTGQRKVYNAIRNLTQYNFTTRVTFSTVVDQAYYKLPGDLKSLKLVMRIDDENNEVPMDFAYWPHPSNWSSQLGLSTDQGGLPDGFWIVGDSLRLVPTPSAIDSFRLYYEARLVDLAADADTPSADADYHDLMALWAAILARTKQSWPADDLKDIYKSRENDCLKDILTRLPANQQETEGYLQNYIG